MISNNDHINYVEINPSNFEVAYQIQKTIFPDEADYDNFNKKKNHPFLYDTCFLIYLDEVAIGITGTYVEEFDSESIWLDWFGILPEYRGNRYGEIVLLDTIHYCQEFKKFKYFRLDTTYWEGRPAVRLYDKVMGLKEKYTIEDTETQKHNYLIYSYDLIGTGYIKPWNNRFVGLVEHYNRCHE